MPITTTNLGLNKTDTTPDGEGSFVDKNEYFNFDTDLNDNWDVIDSATGKLSDLTTTEKGSLVGAINELKNEIPDSSTNVTHTASTQIGSSSRPIYVTSSGVATACSGIDTTNLCCTTKATTTSSASSTKPAVIKENYVNGKSWYRVWSDGWIEQGGYISVSSSGASVSLLKAYSNTSYSIVTANNQDSTAVGAGGSCVSSPAPTKNGFTLDCNGLGSLHMYWRTAGY